MLNKNFDLQLIMSKAQEAKLITSETEPIYDGVFDDAMYAKSRICWLLKEPYDDKDENDNPVVGGWSIPKDCFEKDDAWKVPSWEPIIYTMYGILNGMKYEDMDYISPDNGMVDVLKYILYLNLSKMPALHSSSDSKLWEKYQIWKDVLDKQIEHYDPAIVICGSTFNFIKDDIARDAQLIKEFPFSSNMGIYKSGNRYFIATYHPNQRTIGRDLYVDSLIDAVRYITEK